MDSISDILEELWAVASLVIPALESLLELNPKNFWAWVWSSLGFAAVMYFVARFFGKLWFRKYELTITQHALWALASALSGVAVMLCVVGKNLAHGLALLLLAWQGIIKHDTVFADQTFVACYNAVRDLRLEDFSAYPPPGPGVSTKIPLQHSESRLVDARVMMDSAARHFSSAYPAIGRLLRANDGLEAPTSQVKDMVDDYFEKSPPDKNGRRTLSLADSVKMCSDVLMETFRSRSESLETLTYIVAGCVPLTAWGVLFLWVGLSAHTTMKIRIKKRTF